MRPTRLSTLAVSAVLAAAPLAAALAQPQGPGGGYGDGPYYPGHMMWGGGWFMGPVMMLVFLAIAAAVVVLIVRWLWPGHSSSGGSGGGGQGRALDILEERFARGEIDKDEFEEKKRTLRR